MLKKQNISLESIVQRRRAMKSDAPGAIQPTEPQPVILITYETTEAAVKQALESIAAQNVISARPQMIRIEKLS